MLFLWGKSLFQMRTRKRILSIFLIISMVITLIPHAFAINNTSPNSVPFEGTIEFDTLTFDPTNIEIKVYSAIPREKEVVGAVLSIFILAYIDLPLNSKTVPMYCQSCAS